jgi:hypothetical protein
VLDEIGSHTGLPTRGSRGESPVWGVRPIKIGPSKFVLAFTRCQYSRTSGITLRYRRPMASCLQREFLCSNGGSSDKWTHPTYARTVAVKMPDLPSPLTTTSNGSWSPDVTAITPPAPCNGAFLGKVSKIEIAPPAPCNGAFLGEVRKIEIAPPAPCNGAFLGEVSKIEIAPPAPCNGAFLGEVNTFLPGLPGLIMVQ